MICSIGYMIDETMAEIVGTASITKGIEDEEITPGYLFVEGVYSGETHYILNGEVTLRPTLALPDTIEATAGVELVLDLGVTGVRVTVDGDDYGVNEDATVEFTPTTPDTFTFRFEKFPYLPKTVTVHAN